MNTNVLIRSTEPIHIIQRALTGDEELALGGTVIGTFIDNRLIARTASAPGTDYSEYAAEIDVPILYMGEEQEDGSVRAELIGIGWFEEADESEAWKGEEPKEEGMHGVMLGVVFRLSKDRKHPDNLRAECEDHFQRILEGQAVPVVDKILEGL